MEPYRHTQRATAIQWAFGIAAVVVGLLAMRGGAGSGVLLVVVLILFVTVFVFASLTVEVTDGGGPTRPARRDGISGPGGAIHVAPA